MTLGISASIAASPTTSHESVVAPKAATTKQHWFQIGKASWYGGRFNGKKTANGEKYDMNAQTCAHRTAPLGSWLRVTNLRNQKSTFVRVNDRGPLSTGLIVDLSYGAAKRLGVAGLAKVKIEEVKATDPTLIAALVNEVPLLPAPLAFGR